MAVLNYNGQNLGGERGPTGPDGNPIGAIISFMGTSAPTDYLVCDGSTYQVSAYPTLARFFQEQFGDTAYFGGDGTSTFAVPDLRNLFLRGYHGDTEEELSGEIGEKQEATEHYGLHPQVENDRGNVIYGYNGNISSAKANWEARYPDTTKSAEKRAFTGTSTTIDNNSSKFNEISGFTSRPVNMAVLYCIKAVSSIPVYGPSLEEYDTEDGWHVRKWSDGYVEMMYSEIKDFDYSRLITGTNYVGKRTASAVVDRLDYPIPLVQLYSIAPSIAGLGNGIMLTDYGGVDNIPNRLLKSPTYGLGTQATYSMPYNQPMLFTLCVTGRWK